MCKDTLKLTAENFDVGRIGIEEGGNELEVGETTFCSGGVYELEDGRKMGIVKIDPLERKVKFRYDTNDVTTINSCSFEEFAKLGINTDGLPIRFWQQRHEHSHRCSLYDGFQDYLLSEALGAEDHLIGIVDSEAGVVWTDREEVGHDQLMGEFSMFETDVRVEFQYSKESNTWLISGNSDEILEFLTRLPKMVPNISTMDCNFKLQPIDAKNNRLTYDGKIAMGRKWLRARMKQLWHIADIDFDDGREYFIGKRYGLRPRREDEEADEYRQMVWRVKDLRIERGRLLPRQEYGESLSDYWQRLNENVS